MHLSKNNQCNHHPGQTSAGQADISPLVAEKIKYLSIQFIYPKTLLCMYIYNIRTVSSIDRLYHHLNHVRTIFLSIYLSESIYLSIYIYTYTSFKHHLDYMHPVNPPKKSWLFYPKSGPGRGSSHTGGQNGAWGTPIAGWFMVENPC